MESPSLVQAVLRLPGTLLRLPFSALTALETVSGLADQLDRLMTVLERLEGGLSRAGTGIDLAALGMSRAVSGLEGAVGAPDASPPSISDLASALRTLTERLSGVAVELATELPKATKSLEDVSPEVSNIVGLLDERSPTSSTS